MTNFKVICFTQVEKHRRVWYGRAVRSTLIEDDGRRAPAKRGRHQRRAATQERTQVGTKKQHTILHIAIDMKECLIDQLYQSIAC